MQGCVHGHVIHEKLAAGHQNDDINMDKIFTAIGELDDINAIILVANGSEARINKAVQNTFVRLRNNIPNDVLDNTLAVLTNCTDLTRSVHPFGMSEMQHGHIYCWQARHAQTTLHAKATGSVKWPCLRKA